MYQAQSLLRNQIEEISESVKDLLTETVRKLVGGASAIFFLVWMFAGLSRISAKTGNYFSLLLSLALVSTVAWLVSSRYPQAALMFWLIGVSGIVMLSQVHFPDSIFLFFYVPLPIVATILISWSAGAALEALIIGQMLLLSQWQSTSFLTIPNMQVVFVSLLLFILGWTSYDLFFSLIRWASFYSGQAKKALEEARVQQVELLETQEDLLTANQELARLTERLKILQQIADEARQAKAEFVANVSHELRAPLNMIIGYSEIITRSGRSYGSRLPAPLLADITTIQRNAQHLTRLVDDVLDLSQIEAGRMELHREKSSIHQIVESAIEVVHPLFVTKNLSLESRLPPDLPPVFCDQTRIRQIIINLLSNAGRFTRQGGVTVTVEQLSAEIICMVADTGPGIPKEQQERLFQPFHQVDASLRREHGGSGLGLSISKQFVEMHGGKIWLESEVDQGTTIFFSLPLTMPIEQSAAPAASGARRWVTEYTIREPRIRPFRVKLPKPRPSYVFVEAGNTLKRSFDRYYENAIAASFTEVDAAIEELTRSPAQALVLNIAEVFSQAGQAQLELKLANLPYETPVISCWLPGKDDFARELGVIDYVIKPINVDNLLDTVQKTGEKVKSILVVDDDEDTLRLIMRILLSTPHGYQVWRATSGDMALKQMRLRKPDLVLLDIVLPEKGGLQVLNEKREDESIRDIPVIIISSRDPVNEKVTTTTLMVNRRSGLTSRELVDFIRSVSQTLTPHVRKNGARATERLPG